MKYNQYLRLFDSASNGLEFGRRELEKSGAVKENKQSSDSLGFQNHSYTHKFNQPNTIIENDFKPNLQTKQDYCIA